MKSGTGWKYETENALVSTPYCGSFVTLSTLMSLLTTALSNVITLEERWFENAPNIFPVLHPESYLSVLLFCHLQKFTCTEKHLFCCSAWCQDNFSPWREFKLLHFSPVAKEMTWNLLSFSFGPCFFPPLFKCYMHREQYIFHHW